MGGVGRRLVARLRQRSAAHLIAPIGVGLALCAPSFVSGGSVAPTPLPTSVVGQAQLVDEFDGPAGSSPGPGWVQQTGGGRWGSGEIETYTSSRDNSYLDGQGHLVLVIKPNTKPHALFPYTSARLTSKTAVGPYFRAEVRMKVPTGVGLWPNFWFLGGTVADPDWPHQGEIDVAEVIGRLPTTTFATPHGYSDDPTTQPVAHVWHLPTQLDTHEPISDAFHTWAVEVRPDLITWTFDGTPIKTFTKAQLPPGAHWSFGYKMHAILDIAAGGFFAGAPDQSTVFPQKMIVDYVRVDSLSPSAS